MRPRPRPWIGVVLAVGSGLLTTLALTLPALTGSASAAPASITHTVRAIVRPVTASGHAAPGYTIESGAQVGPIDCSGKEPSAAAVDRNIVYCSPSAASALACWPANRKHHVLCLVDARRRTLLDYRVTGPISATKPNPVGRRLPLDVRLGNGWQCRLRDGGAGSILQHHPNWAVVYYCDHDAAIWAPIDHPGIDRTHPIWRVQVAPADGTGTLGRRGIGRAWFVGTRS